MKNIISKVIFVFLLFSSVNTSNAQDKINYTKKESRNNWGLGFVYSENGFGISVAKYLPVGNSVDFSLSLLFSGVSDSREVTRYDAYGNSIVPDKVNRVFMMPLSIGLNIEMFKGDLDGSFKPVFNIGVAPSLIFVNPYNKSFFSALGYTTTKFAAGPYAGMGINYKQSESMSININLNYYYLPVMNGEIESLLNNKIDNVGGVQLTFGMNFLK